MRVVNDWEVLMSRKVMKPTDAELEILQILWEMGPGTVRQVNDELNRIRKIGYTTTLKMMQIMLDKGMLSRNEDQRSHLYSALLKEKETQNLLLNKLVTSAFGGSALKLVVSALGNGKTSRNELAKIKNFIEAIESRQGDE
jgi:BlaI family penicillinase repressor